MVNESRPNGPPPFSEFYMDIVCAIRKRKGAPMHAAENATVHLEKAWKIIGIDNQMALFRMMTAKEEAVASIAKAFSRRSYIGHNKLFLSNHAQKNMFMIVCDQAKDYFSNFMKLIINESILVSYVTKTTILKIKPKATDEDNVLMIDRKTGKIDEIAGWIIYNKIELTQEVPEDQQGMIVQDLTGSSVDFFDYVVNVAKSKGTTLTKWSREEGNKRNLLLYASDQGLPEDPENMVETWNRYHREILYLLLLYAMIDQEKSSIKEIAQGTLTSLIKMWEEKV